MVQVAAKPAFCAAAALPAGPRPSASRAGRRAVCVAAQQAPSGGQGSAGRRQPAPLQHHGDQQRRSSVRRRPQLLGDPELVEVLSLASDEELEGIWEVLHGRALFSPLLKSLVAEREEGGAALLQGRDLLIARIDRRLRFLAADAGATLRGRWPGYREVLMMLRDKLGIRCPPTLLTNELEAEVFLHVLERHADAVDAAAPTTASAAAVAGLGDGGAAGRRRSRDARGGGSGSSSNPLQRLLAPLKLGSEEVMPALAGLTSALAVSNLKHTLLHTLGGQLVKKELALHAALHAAKEGGRRVAVQAAKEGFTAAASRYAAARSLLGVVGPLLWASTALDLLMVSIGTDYARVVKAVFALAQIRLLRTGGFSNPAAPAPSP